jgi:hypothetical protein
LIDWPDVLPLALRLKIELAPFLASGDENPLEPVPANDRPTPPVALVLGSIREEAWVFGSTK